MEVKIEVPQYDPVTGLRYSWTDGFEIKIAVDNGTILMKANKEGLISMANHLLNLAQEDVPKYNHVHLDEFNSLEEGSRELIIEKI